MQFLRVFKKHLEISDFIFFKMYFREVVTMEYCLKMFSSAYC